MKCEPEKMKYVTMSLKIAGMVMAGLLLIVMTILVCNSRINYVISEKESSEVEVGPQPTYDYTDGAITSSTMAILLDSPSVIMDTIYIYKHKLCKVYGWGNPVSFERADTIFTGRRQAAGDNYWFIDLLPGEYIVGYRYQVYGSRGGCSYKITIPEENRHEFKYVNPDDTHIIGVQNIKYE